MNDTPAAIPINERLSAATAAARDGELDAAIVELKQILAEAPGHEVALGMLAAIYLQLGMLDKAIDHFSRLLGAHPENPLARFQLGMAHLADGDAQQALDTWEGLLEQEGEFMGHFHSGLALLQLERPHEARPMFEIALRNMPESHPLYPQLAQLLSSAAGEDDGAAGP